MKIYHVQFGCGDYYCDEMHTVGIFDDKVLAEKGIPEYKARMAKSLGQQQADRYLVSCSFKVVERELNAVESYGE